MAKYVSKAKTVTIEATSRISLKINDVYATFEYTEARSIPDVDGIDIEEEKRLLWEDVIAQTDDQADAALKVMGGK